MASNSFGNIFRITTWGESHGKAIGVVIDGCPSNLPLSEEDIQEELLKRAPGLSPFTSPRKETDKVEILSGVFEGVTTGAPISLIIWNRDANSSAYTSMKDLLRPGHANFTYLQKYGVFDYRGGGRASARETACRVAAGAIAKKILRLFSIEVIAYIKEIGGIGFSDLAIQDVPSLREKIASSPIFCPDVSSSSMMDLLEETQKEGDSLGGIVECLALGLPAGLGDPVYEKLEANLSKAILSIPATKGIEFGEGFFSADMKGSEHNDCFMKDPSSEKIFPKTNHAGGTLGGISTGMPLVFRTAFKPPSSIAKKQTTVNLQGEETVLELPEGSRHDPCVAIRGVLVVEAMTALCLVDALLMDKIVRIPIN